MRVAEHEKMKKTIVEPNFTSNVKGHSFAYRSIDANKLPNYAVNSESVNDFKSNMHTFLTFNDI